MQDEVFDCDVLVIGSGAAGLATAVTASVLGLDVILTEHAPHFGGASAISGGEVWIPLNRQAGGSANDSEQAAIDYLAAVIGDRFDRTRVETYVRNAAAALAFLEDNSHLEYELLETVVDYFTDIEGATKGLRSLGAVPFDGRRLGKHFKTIRSPLPASMIFGGMSLGRLDIPHFSRFTRSLPSLIHVCGMLANHLRDRLMGHHRGTRMVMGNALVGRLVLTLLEHGVAMWANTATLDLVSKNDRVMGALVAHPTGRRLVNARHAVVIATGSFSGSRQKQIEFMPHVRAGQQHRSHLPATNDGSGLDLVRTHGGNVDSALAQPAAFTPVSVIHRPDGTEWLTPHFGDRAKPGVIVVDDRGNRIANEATNYHDFVGEMLRHCSGKASAEYYLVTSHRHLRAYGLGRVPASPGRISPFLRNGYLLKGQTLNELAEKLGIEAVGLVRTVEAHDRYAAIGEDPDFKKGGTAFEQAAGDATNKPNPCVAPLGDGPFYAIRIIPGDIGTFAGISVDARGQVLTETGAKIPGLFAVGTAASSVMGGTYPGAGAMLGPALTFGYLAAKAIAEERADLHAKPPEFGQARACEKCGERSSATA
jgi:succinate dehydrogenase/fumarate reductase flavoprotein subunit